MRCLLNTSLRFFVGERVVEDREVLTAVLKCLNILGDFYIINIFQASIYHKHDILLSKQKKKVPESCLKNKQNKIKQKHPKS